MAIISQSTAQTRVEQEIRHESDRAFWRDILASLAGVLTGTKTQLSADTLAEQTSGAGVTVDGLLIKDGAVVPGQQVVMGSDFLMKALDETNENWILNSGNDDLAVDPAIVIAEGGTVFLDAGDGDGSIAADGSQIAWAIPVQADSGGLTVYARAKIEDITGCSVNIGLTDVTTLEEPFSIGGSDAITSVATNAVCAVFDDGADTKEWFFCGARGDTDATGNGATGIAPVNDTYQDFRIEIDADGEGARLYIDDTLAGTLTAAACAASTNLYLTAVICGDGANSAAVGLTVDYLYVKHNR